MTRISLTLDRALQVLGLLRNGPARASEIALALGLNRTVTHRLLATLQLRRFLVQIDNRYYLGDAIRPLAEHVETELQGAATDPVSQLCERTGGMALLTVRSGLLASLLTFTHAESWADVVVIPEVGTPHSVLDGPQGLAMLAFSEPATIAKARRRIDDAARFDRLLEETRAAGWTSESINPTPHPLHELAAPIRHRSAYADAALALLLPA
ncbi:helix-turn-helix domain-containing protein, partial [Leucobacter soli]